MKKILFLALYFFTLNSYCQLSNATIVVTNSGGTTTYNSLNVPEVIYIYASAITLTSDVTVNYSAVPPIGTHWEVITNLQLSKNSHNFTVFGQSLDDYQVGGSGLVVSVFNFDVVTNQVGGAQVVASYAPISFKTGGINGDIILDGTIAYSALDTVGSARVLLGNGSNLVSSAKLGGAITMTNTGVTTLDSVVVDANIKTGAAIKRQKLAAGTASYVVVNNSSGQMVDEATLNPLRGGLGTNASSSTGFVTFSSGSATIGTMTETRDLHVSFAANSQGTYYLTFPVGVTVTNIEARVETALGATDSATILLQNDASANMTGNNLVTGYLVLAASATTGTGYTSTLLSNNAFTAGQRMRLTTAKTTVGGTANVQITYTRTN